MKDMMPFTRQSYPKGRAFAFSNDSFLYKLHSALHKSEQRTIDALKNILSQIMPDNEHFSDSNILIWEKRLNIVSNIFTSQEDRKKAILRKLAYPGTIRARQTRLYIEEQLQAAGFPVYVYDNIRTDNGKPYTIGIGVQKDTELGLNTELGINTELGGIITGADLLLDSVVINSLYANEEKLTAMDEVAMRSTFIIAGHDIYTQPRISSDREIELRNIILSLKPLGDFAFLNVKYINIRPWILENGIWDDSKFWNDEQLWID